MNLIQINEYNDNVIPFPLKQIDSRAAREEDNEIEEMEEEKEINKLSEIDMEKREEIVDMLSIHMSITEIHEIFDKYNHNYDYILHNLYYIFNTFRHSIKNLKAKGLIKSALTVDFVYEMMKNPKDVN